ncbi:MAG: hypothetical protein MUP63_02080 [Candidatus Nanohaloarchaeota archaeon QJJ-7]|nr:hypothetical protein [Candidatus Nanohaloarchaeota archaeon QJJ-7]
MGKGYCQHGCYPVDKRWHGGGLEDGEGNSIDSIWDLREYIRKNGGGKEGAEAAEELLRENQPGGEPYILPGGPDEQAPIMEKKKHRKISIADIGQGFDILAHLTSVDKISTHYRYDDQVTVKDWIRTSPQSQVHQEYMQRRQQAEQQINRVLSNLQDLYEQKQLLEHDLRRLEERMAHFEASEDDKGEGGGYEDELKADFVDLVDQHTGRHSILQMQANNVFPSITADFYQMSGLDDMEDGPLKDLPENEKAVLRKKWKLYQQWKDQFRTAVESRLRDVRRQINSVETSIEQTQEWLKPYVEDMKRIQPEGQFEEELEVGQAVQWLTPHGYANMYRQMKTLAKMDRSPGEESGKYYDVVSFEPLHIVGAGLEQPQAAGQGLVILSMGFMEITVCKHVYEEIFKPQEDARVNEVQNYIQRYIGEAGELDSRKDNIREMYGGVLTEEEEDRIENASTEDALQEIELELIDRMRPSFVDRVSNRVKRFFGFTDDFYHEDPEELRRELLGPYFPTQFYLDYKYDNDLYVMK